MNLSIKQFDFVFNIQINNIIHIKINLHSTAKNIYEQNSY